MLYQLSYSRLERCKYTKSEVNEQDFEIVITGLRKKGIRDEGISSILKYLTAEQLYIALEEWDKTSSHKTISTFLRTKYPILWADQLHKDLLISDPEVRTIVETRSHNDISQMYLEIKAGLEKKAKAGERVNNPGGWAWKCFTNRFPDLLKYREPSVVKNNYTPTPQTSEPKILVAA